MGLLRRLAREEEDSAREGGGSAQTPGRRAALPEGITPREVEVLRLLARGLTNPQIADDLAVARGTVKIHVQNIIAKLGVSDRTQAAVRAIELGLLDPDDTRRP